MQRFFPQLFAMNPLAYVLRLGRWFKDWPAQVIFIAFCLLVEMGFSAFVPLAFSHLIDEGIAPRNSGVLVNTLLALCIVTVLATVAGMASDYIYAQLSSRVLVGIRQKLFDHLQTLSPSFFQKYSAGEVSARYSTDLTAVEQTLGSWIPWGWKPALDVIGYNLVMFWVDWRLALFAQLLWPMTFLGPRIFAPKASLAADERKSHEAAVLSAVDEATMGRSVVRAFGIEAKMSERFADKLSQLAGVTVRGAFFTSALERSAGVGIYLLQIAIITIGGSMAFKGTISVGGLVAFYTVFVSLSLSLYYLAQYSGSLINSAAGLVRIEEFLNERPTVVEDPSAAELPPIKKGIAVKNCVYSPELGRRVIDEVSLTINHGDFVAFVGPSGSGKSTMLNAIMRNFDPDEGAVEIDGHDLRSVTRASFTRQSAVVFQETFLYNTTVRENLKLGRLDATDAEIEAACRDAEIHDIIVQMPHGYESPVGERGSLLSGGQKQRLAIARALVRSPSILFLDEATSALDPGAETAINQTLERISPGRTVITVTHRLASVVNCKQVFVMDRGKLAEQGAHAELLAKDGIYASLWRKQEGINTSDDGANARISIQRLRLIPMLASLGDEILAKLATEQLVTEQASALRQVVVQGESADKFYIIARGQVEVLRQEANGNNVRVSVLEDGDYFGEMALIRDIPRQATARTLTPCTFLTLQRQHFQRLLDHSPEVRAAILAQAEERSKMNMTGSPSFAATADWETMLL
jgi:ATP-binding cassette, subfamily B, bacterial